MYAGDALLVAAVLQRARSILRVSRQRAVLRAWLSAAHALLAERQAAAFHVAQSQAAKKADIASRFHRLWMLHAAFQGWKAHAHAAAEAAWQQEQRQAAEARQLAANAAAAEARYTIAAQFHVHYTKHATLCAWRTAVRAAIADKHLAAESAQRQDRIAAVMSQMRGQPEACAASAVQHAASEISLDSSAAPPRHENARRVSFADMQAPAAHEACQNADTGTCAEAEGPCVQASAEQDCTGVSNSAGGASLAFADAQAHCDADSLHFEQGLMRVTAALTDSMRTTRRLASRHHVHQGNMAGPPMSSAPGRLVAQHCSTETQSGSPARASLPTRLCSGRDSAVLPVHHSVDTGADDAHALRSSEQSRDAKNDSTRQSPTASAVGPHDQCQESLARGSVNSSDATPTQGETAAGQCQADSANQVQHRVAETITRVKAKQPPPDDAPWEDYVRYLQDQVLDESDEPSTQEPAARKHAAMLSSVQHGSSAADDHQQEPEKPLLAPLADVRKMKGKAAKDAVAAQLARIRAAAGTMLLPVKTSLHYISVHCLTAGLHAPMRGNTFCS